MLSHANQEVVRFRASWRLGESYHRGDVAARGMRSYRSLKHHVAGAASEPGHGDDWTSYWEAYGLDDELHGVQRRQLAVIETLPPANAPAPSVPAVPAVPVDERRPAAVPTQQVLPPQDMRASDIIDDSGEGPAMNVAFALDALRQQLKAVQQKIATRQTAGPDQTVSAPPQGEGGCELTAELWRRKADILGATSIAECQAMMHAAQWEWSRLIRKLQRGEVWTSEEVARNAILESIDQLFCDLDRAYDRLRSDPPLDVDHDRHWKGRR